MRLSVTPDDVPRDSDHTQCHLSTTRQRKIGGSRNGSPKRLRQTETDIHCNFSLWRFAMFHSATAADDGNVDY